MAYRSRDRVARVLAHQEADRVPYAAIQSRRIRTLVDNLAPGADQRAFCLEGDFAALVLEPPPDLEALRPYLGELPEGTVVSCWGVGSLPLTTDDGWGAGSRTFHPLAAVNTVEELDRYPFPNVAASGVAAGLAERVAALKAQGYTVLGQMSQTILETAYLMRGMPALMADFYERPAYIESLFEKLAAQRRFQARAFAEAGVDILRIGDDIATQNGLLVSPQMYRERIKPFHAGVIAAAQQVAPALPVKYHSDGSLTPLVPDLIDIGVTILNPVQPECMDLAAIRREYGRYLTLWGCMPCQSIVPHGGRNEMVAHLDFLMREIAPGGGLVVKFTNYLETDRSLANLRTFFETFWEIGRYHEG